MLASQAAVSSRPLPRCPSSSAHCECSTQELVEVLDRSLEACCTPRDLEVLNVIVVFAAMFKKTRFELGIPQRVLGQAMEHIRRPDGRSDRGALSQTTVSTFEELRMTPILMLRYLPAFQRALQAMLTDELQVVYPSVPKEKAATLLSTRFAELQKWELQAEQTFWNAVDHCFSSSDIFEWQQAKNFYRNVTLPPSCLEAQPSSNAGATEFY
ncbi:hypothetical protein L596_015970 [Steinernema carpocapsae]|uniref:POU-specific domain-containing protein n=1 Tax=Steinernema carpocapsae TaxID=34508 RepID=A0A4U5NHM6_STECR|nr:hypothetical protein L596_015970 [Steinernema carpocapsae]